jgi:hypothetical protein
VIEFLLLEPAAAAAVELQVEQTLMVVLVVELQVKMALMAKDLQKVLAEVEVHNHQEVLGEQVILLIMSME